MSLNIWKPKFEKDQNDLVNFSSILLGPRRCGKSNLILHFLYYNLFDKFHIFVLICPKYQQKDYRNIIISKYLEKCKNQEIMFKEINKRIKHFENIKLAKYYLDKIKKNNEDSSLVKMNCLVILDDTTDNKTKYNDLILKMYIQDRHYNISVLYLVQSASLLSTQVRGNSDMIFIFKSWNARDEKFINQHISDLQPYQNIYTENAYNCIVLTYPDNKKYKFLADHIKLSEIK